MFEPFDGFEDAPPRRAPSVTRKFGVMLLLFFVLAAACGAIDALHP